MRRVNFNSCLTFIFVLFKFQDLSLIFYLHVASKRRGGMDRHFGSQHNELWSVTNNILGGHAHGLDEP
jgi:hypothetical protein